MALLNTAIKALWGEGGRGKKGKLVVNAPVGDPDGSPAINSKSRPL